MTSPDFVIHDEGIITIDHNGHVEISGFTVQGREHERDLITLALRRLVMAHAELEAALAARSSSTGPTMRYAVQL
jgi:hypothetical protein